MKILFSGGGSGGHIVPIIAVSREIRKADEAVRRQLWAAEVQAGKKEGRQEKLEFYYLGPRDDFGSILLSQEGIIVKEIMAGKIRRYFSPLSVLKNIFDVFISIPLGLVQAFFHLFFIAPDLIFSKGGYGSLPVVIAGWLLRIPIFLHESDIAPGFANRLSSRFALEIFVSFSLKQTEYFPLRKMIAVGNPVRQEITEGSLEEAKELFKLIGEKPVLLIIGGSQGSQRINDLILETLPELLMNFEIIHQTGAKNFSQVEAEANITVNENLKKYYHPYPFLKEEQLADAYKAADLIVSRAGSASIFEIASVGKPSILIPLPESAQDHQLKNAYAYANDKAALVIEEANLAPHFFLEKLKRLFLAPEQLRKMGERAKEFSKIQAARIIAAYLMVYLEPRAS